MIRLSSNGLPPFCGLKAFTYKDVIQGESLQKFKKILSEGFYCTTAAERRCGTFFEIGYNSRKRLLYQPRPPRTRPGQDFAPSRDFSVYLLSNFV